MKLHCADILVSSLLAVSILAGSLVTNSPFSGAIIFFMIGIAFIFSKKLKDSLIFFRTIYWISENIFKPKTQFNYLIWGIFLLFIGLIILFSTAPDSREKEFLDGLLTRFDFWVSILFVLLFNAIIGLYTVKNKKKNERKGL